MKRSWLLGFILHILLLSSVFAQDIEVGLVKWGRDLEQAKALSQKSGKPILILFQEVPGCYGCRQFGQHVLSNPKLVKVIEGSFVPVLVYNNRSSDVALLKKFNEPSWNYQVVRFIDEDGKDILPRKDKVWTLSALSKRMLECLQKRGRDIPEALKELAQT